MRTEAADATRFTPTILQYEGNFVCAALSDDICLFRIRQAANDPCRRCACNHTTQHLSSGKKHELQKFAAKWFSQGTARSEV